MSNNANEQNDSLTVHTNPAGIRGIALLCALLLLGMSLFFLLIALSLKLLLPPTNGEFVWYQVLIYVAGAYCMLAAGIPSFYALGQANVRRVILTLDSSGVLVYLTKGEVFVPWHAVTAVQLHGIGIPQALRIRIRADGSERYTGKFAPKLLKKIVEGGFVFGSKHVDVPLLTISQAAHYFSSGQTSLGNDLLNQQLPPSESIK